MIAVSVPGESILPTSPMACSISKSSHWSPISSRFSLPNSSVELNMLLYRCGLADSLSALSLSRPRPRSLFPLSIIFCTLSLMGVFFAVPFLSCSFCLLCICFFVCMFFCVQNQMYLFSVEVVNSFL